MTITTRRLRENEARAVLLEELDRAGWQSDSAFTVRDGRRPDTEMLAWWHANTPANERSDTARNLAYLRAYQRIARGGQLHAGGLFLDRRRLWMDRSVISRLERDGYLRFEEDAREPWFALTEQGERYAATGDS